ncbi:TadE family type IV pilus minor pilin [Nonomuraea recticatena]|uniref:TadE family type IV pilus minor pilin n=1 Tax=Nonomuraea recticatena TaxID=46178 RepID=UPI0031F91082
MSLPQQASTPRSPARPCLKGTRASRGSVTAETAAVLPALMVVLAAALWAVTVVNAHLRCVDAARAGARAAARGEPIAKVQELARTVAPPGAQVDIRRGADMTRVQVTTHIKPSWASALPPIEVKAAASSATEPGTLEPPGASSPLDLDTAQPATPHSH